ncbi:MAG: hypothetical protein ACFHWZ_12855 [Phycisphaerales bacterium]
MRCSTRMIRSARTAATSTTIATAARITQANFDDDGMLIFDALGGPVQGLTSEESSEGGFVEIVGGANDEWVFRINVSPMTGRIVVERVVP